jgi:hypothetical protein
MKYICKYSVVYFNIFFSNVEICLLKYQNPSWKCALLTFGGVIWDPTAKTKGKFSELTF